ncbi:hypothetical protein F5Y19DRAFT_482579 [Xylariaceae sp. FL1651]|nr:hypothetical protein F5Y19DRAFT_482579 [Xylariaceae sp. FL1651]
MNNFGVIELASTKTTNAPGWAYVPDTPHAATSTAAAAAAAAAPTNRKRARNTGAAGAGALSLADANARQEAKARREIEILDRDNARDAQIAIPTKKSGGGGSGGGTKKYTPNVRKILQSQKTFANHLDDYVALLDANPGGATTTTSSSLAAAGSGANAAGGSGSSSSGAGANTAAAAAGSSSHAKRTAQQQQRRTSTPATPATTRKPMKQEEEPGEDVEMTDAFDPVSTASATAPPQQPRSSILTPHPPPPAHPMDANPLLVSRVPPLPSDAELKALLAAPPLSYLEARGTWPSGNNAVPAGSGGTQYPPRVFCVVCGYWGRVRCMKCGTRVCALDCLETHREECVTRYGL